MMFRAPLWLWLAAAAPVVLVFLLARERSRTRVAQRLVSERLRGVANPARVLRPYLLALALVAASVALAGPEAGFTTIPVTNRESSRVIVIDVSNSMAAEDVGASRLAAAKAIAKRLVEAGEGRIAVVAFERQAEVVAPLTNDDEAVISLIDTLQPGEVGEPGSDLGASITAALKLLQAETNAKADIVLISDGEEQGGRFTLTEALHRAKTRGVSVSAIAVGTPAGATIPTGSGVLRDESGEIITTREQSDVLQRIARTTGGRFLDNPFSENALGPLLAQRSAAGDRSRPIRVPIDRYQWPLAIAFAAFFCGSLANRGAE
ncbi:MAG TPA: VWA domain-containing protein [Thermoanaerobaculia bacterium]|nr:VWA domain-containing protein [Thermoanaerobaculia bacterium]